MNANVSQPQSLSSVNTFSTSDCFIKPIIWGRYFHLTSAIRILSGSAAKSRHTYITAYMVTGAGISLVPTCTTNTAYLSYDRTVERRQDFINSLNQTAQCHAQCLWGVGKDNKSKKASPQSRLLLNHNHHHHRKSTFSNPLHIFTGDCIHWR